MMWLIIVVISWLIWVYRSFFGVVPLSSGDWGVNFSDGIAQFSLMPQAWNTHFGNGLGGNDVFLLALNTYYYLLSGISGTLLRLPWFGIERLFWYWPFWGIGIIGSYLLAKQVTAGSKYSVLAPVIYLTNTYVLMIVGGGQMGVAMGYAVAPFVLWGVINWFEHAATVRWVRAAIVVGGLFSVVLLFDLRVAYILLIPSVAYVFIRVGFDYRKMSLWRMASSAVLACGVIVTLHFFWLYPFVTQGTNPLTGLGDAFINPDMVRFLSFAPFEHTLSLLHPNWPENIFGKIRFLQPEFLVIPIIAYGALMFIARKKRYIHDSSAPNHQTLAFFAFVGLIGAFFAKGTNPPFGDVYLWLFNNVPGFVMLRDSTKFFVLTALSYCVLIPFFLDRLYNVSRHMGIRRVTSERLMVVLFMAVWLVLHREALTGKLTGVFAPERIPIPYTRLQQYLSSETSFSRVLWIPSRQRYGFFSDTMPGLSLDTLKIASYSAFADWMSSKESNEQLSRLAVSHIIVPSDPKGELFVSDRVYDDKKRQQYVRMLDADADIMRLDTFGDIAVYKTKLHYGHIFYQNNQHAPVGYERVSPTRYNVAISAHTDERQLIFSETFDPQWELVIGARHISPQRTVDGLQMFVVPPVSADTISYLFYKPQQLVAIGIPVSGLSLIVIAAYLSYATIVLWKKRRVS